MKFPDKYKILGQNVFAQGDYKLVPIRYGDRHEIMKWRNEQMYHLRQDKPLTEESQDIYFDTVVAELFNESKPSQLLFSYLKNDICIGYGGLVHINWDDGNAEISFIMKTELEPESFNFHWRAYLSLIEELAFSLLGLHKIYVYAFDLRPHLYKALEQAGYINDARLRDHLIIEGKYTDVVIHSKIAVK